MSAVQLLFSDVVFYFVSMLLPRSIPNCWLCYCRLLFVFVFVLLCFVYIVISYDGWLAFFWCDTRQICFEWFCFLFNLILYNENSEQSIYLQLTKNAIQIWIRLVMFILFGLHLHLVDAVQMLLFFIQWEFKIKSNTAPKCYRWYLGSHVTKFQKCSLKYELYVANVKKWVSARKRDGTYVCLCVCVCGKRTCGSNLNTEIVIYTYMKIYTCSIYK